MTKEYIGGQEGLWEEKKAEVEGTLSELLALEERRLNLAKVLQETKELLSRWEVETLAGIEAEVDDNGKKKFSNEVQRRAELEKRKSTDEGYQSLKDAAWTQENELKKLDLQIREKETGLKLGFAWLRFIEAKLRALAA